MLPSVKSLDQKVANAILLPTVTPQFRFRKPRRMIQFSTDSRLDCYEVAGQLSRFDTESLVLIEQPLPIFSDDQETQTEDHKSSGTITDVQSKIMAKPLGNSVLTSQSTKSNTVQNSPRTLPFNFCSITSDDNKDININSSAPQSPKPQKKYMLCGSMKCSAFEKEQPRITKQNRCHNCPNCSQQGYENSKYKNNYTIQKKRIFWEIWLDAKERTNLLPKANFEETFRTYKYEDRDAWQRIVSDIFK